MRQVELFITLHVLAISFVLFLLTSLFSHVAMAQGTQTGWMQTTIAQTSPRDKPIASQQDLMILKTKVADFLRIQSAGYPGRVNIQVGAIDPNLRLVMCPDVQVFLPAGSRAWGKTSVGLMCNAPNPWTIYVQGMVNVVAPYLVAAKPLAQGATVASEDVLFENGDLTQLPAGIFTTVEQVLGRTVGVSLSAGAVLRSETLKAAPVVQQGQTVVLTSAGRGFKVSAEGQAMAKASEGQVVQVKVANGQVVNGIARQGGVIEVAF